MLRFVRGTKKNLRPLRVVFLKSANQRRRVECDLLSVKLADTSVALEEEVLDCGGDETYSHTHDEDGDEWLSEEAVVTRRDDNFLIHQDDEVRYLRSNQEVYKALVDNKMYFYFLSETRSYGNQRKVAHRICKRVADLLSFLYHDAHNDFLDGAQTMQYFGSFLRNDFRRLHYYCCSWLPDRLKLTPSTILNYLSDFSLAARWRAYHYLGNQEEEHQSFISLEAFHAITESIRRYEELKLFQIKINDY